MNRLLLLRKIPHTHSGSMPYSCLVFFDYARSGTSEGSDREEQWGAGIFIDANQKMWLVEADGCPWNKRGKSLGNSKKPLDARLLSTFHNNGYLSIKKYTSTIKLKINSVQCIKLIFTAHTHTYTYPASNVCDHKARVDRIHNIFPSGHSIAIDLDPSIVSHTLGAIVWRACKRQRKSESEKWRNHTASSVVYVRPPLCWSVLHTFYSNRRCERECGLRLSHYRPI